MAVQPAGRISGVTCPALILASTGDHQGRTNVAAAMARHHHNQGRKVRVFKAGADFYGPFVHQCASGEAVELLDSWLVGESRCRNLLYEAAERADLIIIECNSDLYDARPACAELSRLYSIPLYIVIDADGDNSSGYHEQDELVEEVVTLTSELPVAGVIVNRTGVDFNAMRLSSRLVNGVRYLGAIPKQPEFELPSRHQDMLSEAGYRRLDKQLDVAAGILADNLDIEFPVPVNFSNTLQTPVPKLLEGLRVGVARDEAFAFIYQANIKILQDMGAEVHYFSPLHDRYVPDVDSLWFPGGFPELHLDELAQNVTMKASIREFHHQHKPILAECGGMIYMLGSLVDRAGVESGMVGLLPGKATMLDHVAAVGLQSVAMDDQVIRGHVFHYSRLEGGMQPVCVSNRRYGRRPGETLYQYGSLIASYVHFYFPSSPLLTARFFGSPLFSPAPH